MGAINKHHHGLAGTGSAEGSLMSYVALEAAWFPIQSRRGTRREDIEYRAHDSATLAGTSGCDPAAIQGWPSPLLGLQAAAPLVPAWASRAGR